MDDFPPFVKYCSIENSYRDNELRYIAAVLPDPSLEWVALEKIHGCNFSGTTDGSTVKWGSRTAYLGDSALGSFNNAIVATRKYEDNVKALFRELKESNPTLSYIRVFGELFGGTYPGHQLPHRYKAIQKGIFYTPDVEFMVFDIKLAFEKESPDDAEDVEAKERDEYDGFMNPEDVITHCRQVGLQALDIMHRGTLAEMLSLDASFESTIPGVLGLPLIEGNVAEGYVLKPVTSVSTGRGRIMLKHKNPKFAENICEKAIKAPRPTELSEEDEQTFLLMLQYINENRFNAVMSKLTDEKKSNLNALVGLTCKDAMDDILKDMGDKVTSQKKGLFQKKLLEYTKAFLDENASSLCAR